MAGLFYICAVFSFHSPIHLNEIKRESGENPKQYPLL